MPENQVEEVKSKINIVDIIGEHVRLNKSGSNFKGLCPFHQEKSPSFMVSPDLQIYKCFGCGEGGDVFTFLEKYEGMEFGEALRYLADKVDVKLINTSSIPTSDKDILYEINSLAGKFYNYLLVSHPVGKMAISYVTKDRGINASLIKTFNIGFAPTKKNVLSDFLIKKKKYTKDDLVKAGVIFVSKSGNIYDRFEGRIIFPISDHRSNVVALAGRQIPPGDPKSGKYINSPETLIYHKSSSLYGLNITKDFIKHEGFAVVVEGEIDLISSFGVGVKNIVAIKGSAFTEDQARLLSRYTKEVVLALDSDFAGVAASIRGIKILEEQGFEIRVAKLGKYKDPDEAARANPEFLKEKISNSINVWDFIVDSVVQKYPVNTAPGKSKISKELTPLLAGITNKIIQEHYIKKLANLLEVSSQAVVEEVGKIKLDIKPKKNTTIPTINNPSSKSLIELREESLVAFILKLDPTLLQKEEIKSLIQTPILKRLALELNGNPNSLAKELFDKYGELVLSIDTEKPDDLKKEINNLYRLLSQEAVRIKIRETEDKKEITILQAKYKEFDSEEFQRII